MESALLALAGTLQDTGLARWASATPWAYPWANVLHLLGLVMLVGAIGVVDLRVAGLWRRLPLAALASALTPVAVAGLLVLFASGLVLFAADGSALSRSTVFHAKLVLIAVALVNVAAFRLAQRRGAGDDVPPLSVRVLALASLGLWLAVGTLGRLIAYN